MRTCGQGSDTAADAHDVGVSFMDQEGGPQPAARTARREEEERSGCVDNARARSDRYARRLRLSAPRANLEVAVRAAIGPPPAHLGPIDGPGPCLTTEDS